MRVERFDYLPRNVFLRNTLRCEVVSSLAFFTEFPKGLGIFSVHKLFHNFYNCFLIHFSSSPGDFFPFSLLAGIYQHLCILVYIINTFGFFG